MRRSVRSHLIASVLLALLIAANSAQAATIKMNKNRSLVTPIFEYRGNPLDKDVSADALQLIDILDLRAKLQRLVDIEAQSAKDPTKLSAEVKDERNEIHLDVLSTVEETRLQIDFVNAEIDEEQVILEEALRVFTEERDDRVNRANLWAFRTNGVLWAVAEALDMPTYKSPKLSIPSGAVGIIAGIVPSVFSAYALRASDGGSFKRSIYPNMMTGIYRIPTIPRVEFPDVVWRWLNSPFGDDKRTRREAMIEHWQNDKNIHIFKGGVNHDKLMLLTGNEPFTTDMSLISDKLIMMGQLKAVTLQMSRPLLEICMVARGKKHFEHTTLDSKASQARN